MISTDSRIDRIHIKLQLTKHSTNETRMSVGESDALLGGSSSQQNQYSGYMGTKTRGDTRGGQTSLNTDLDGERLSQSTTGSELSTEDYYRNPIGRLPMLQARVFIEDAINYRSIHHRVDEKSLKLYRIYHSTACRWFVNFILLVLHALAFFERPSSLTLTADVRVSGNTPRPHIPCGVTEAIELLCLMVLLADLVVKGYFVGFKQFIRSKWLVAYALVVSVSVIDWCVTIGFHCAQPDSFWRFRRLLRPFFLLQNSSLMKKTFNCLRRTLPQVFSVLLLLFMHIYFFTLFGMLLFNKAKQNQGNSTMNTSKNQSPETEQNTYFNSESEAFMNLLVLLTTANNPDVMMPAYNQNRFYVLYFISFLLIGLYCFMNMLTAVIYNQFRGYFLNSMQSSLFRRRLGIRAAFEVLQRRRTVFPHRSSLDSMSDGVPSEVLKAVIEKTTMKKMSKHILIRELKENYVDCQLNAGDIQDLFNQMDATHRFMVRPEISWVDHPYLIILQRICAHRYFTYFGCLVALANVICISVELGMEYDKVRQTNQSVLGILNLVFVLYYMFEQCLKVWALGWRRFAWETGNIYEAVVTLLLVIMEGVTIAMFGIPFWGSPVEQKDTMWNLVRVVNMLIMIRLLRIVTQINAMQVVASTLWDLIRNMKAFAGVLVVLFYSYAIIGMELFRGVITTENINGTKPECGSYKQLEYWSNNFDDFAAALVVLWDVMVVNNWHVFLHAYSKAVNKYAQIYFVVWWLLSVVIAMNLFTALILENFIMRWDRLQQFQRRDRTVSNVSQAFNIHGLTVHDMFRNNLQEPSDDSLLLELRHHPHLMLNT